MCPQTHSPKSKFFPAERIYRPVTSPDVMGQTQSAFTLVCLSTDGHCGVFIKVDLKTKNKHVLIEQPLSVRNQLVLAPVHLRDSAHFLLIGRL